MILSTDQLELISIMLKNQHGDKTFRELFKVNCVDDVKLSDMWLRFGSDIDFYQYGTGMLVAWITSCLRRRAITDYYLTFPLIDNYARIDIVDVIKVLSFEDKI